MSATHRREQCHVIPYVEPSPDFVAPVLDPVGDDTPRLSPDLWDDYGAPICDHPADAIEHQYLVIQDDRQSFRSVDPVPYCTACAMPLLSSRIRLTRQTEGA